MGSYFYIVNNVRQSHFEVVSPEIKNVLGYDLDDITLSFFVNLAHPDDMPFYLNFEAAVRNFFNALTGEQLFRYKVQYDHRVKKADGGYARLLTQYVIIQHSSEDVRTFVVCTDISHLKKEVKPILSFIGLQGEPSYLNVDVDNMFKPSKPLFTKRERQILHGIVNGMSSAEISQQLSISKHTVDSHRKNMLKKADAKSTTEIIKMAFDNGWA